MTAHAVGMDYQEDTIEKSQASGNATIYMYYDQLAPAGGSTDRNSSGNRDLR